MNIGIKRIARQLSGARSNLPVVMIPGDSAPRIEGRGFYHTTPNGTYCAHPNAYRKAFGRTVYHPSTLRVEVGAEFMAELMALALKTR